MSKAGKAAEPSMEEILSSIRKIIAEEPISAVSPAAQKAAVDDVLEMADNAPSAESASRGADAAASGSAVPSWLFPTAHAGAVATSEIEGPVKAALEATRDLPKPFFPAATATPEPKMPAVAASARVGTNGVHPRTTAEAKTSDDLGAVVPRRSPAPAASPVAGVTERRSPQAGLPDWLSRATGGAAKPAPAPQPIGAPAEPTRIAPRDGDAVVPSLSELAKPLPAAADSTAAKPEETTIPMVATDVVSPAPDAAIVATESDSSALVPTDMSAHNPVPKPTLLDRSRGPKSNGTTDVVATVVQASAVRTLDDTIIDLLRPMIRQWLDDNMPRMVEKALRVELAASVKPKADQSKH